MQETVSLFFCEYVAKCLSQVGMPEVVAVVKQLARDDVRATEEYIFGYLAKSQLQRKRGHWKQSGTMECFTQSVREFGVGDRLRDGQVDGTSYGGLFDDEVDDAADFIESDPTHHLVAGTELATKTKAEER